MATLPPYPRGRREIAFHEAAHAVFGAMLGLTHVRVDVFASQPLSGFYQFDSKALKSQSVPKEEIPPEELDLAGLMWAASYVSGVMAETILHGIEVDGWLKRDCQDFRTARTLLTAGSGHDLGLYYAQCLAGHVLSANWDLVAQIAAEIQVRGWLGGEELTRTCAGREQCWASVVDRY